MQTADTEWAARTETNYVDKSIWYRGEWDNEPDRVEWRYHGTPRFPLLIVRGPRGALCGYVGLPQGHPHYDAPNPFRLDLDAPGGITYGERCQENGKICHVARTGEADAVYWLGFDCGHSWDYSDMDTRRYETDESIAPESRRILARPPGSSEEYRTIDYVRRETERLADTLARVAKGLPSNGGRVT